jgi:hypothetical protein
VAKKTPLTEAQKREKERKLFFRKCVSKDEFTRWIKYFLRLDFPDTTVSRFASTNPLDAAWLVYDICVNRNNPTNIADLLYVAGRGSGKTLGMAIAEFMILVHDKRSVAHVGAILAQSKRCYEYQVKFMLSEKIKRILQDPEVAPDQRILQKMNMEKSTFCIDNEIASIEVIPCTLKATNGVHCPLVVVDEIDTVSGEGVRAFKEITGMLDSRGDQVGLRVGISTRKSRYGLMNKQIENADKEGRSVHKWTAFEFCHRCSDENSGTTPTIGYVVQDTMEVVDEVAFKAKDRRKQIEYTQHIFPGEKCLKCPAAAICYGDAKNQTCKSKMLKPINELIQKVRSEGVDWALSQLVNLKPSLEGVVFKEFEEKLHVKSWNAMWLTLTGAEFPGECTHDIFVKKCHQLNMSCYSGIDWGWSNPSTVVYFFVDRRDNIYVVRADGMTYVSDPEWINSIKRRYHVQYRCQLYFPDIANPGSIVEMRKAGLPATNDIDKSIESGIQVIKKFLRTPGSQAPKIFFAQETCGPIINEFGIYHYKTGLDGLITGDIEDKDNHWLDALRYPMMMLFGKNILIIGGGGVEDSDRNITTPDGSYAKTPSAEEFAAANGLNVSTDPPDISKLGKIGTKSDLETNLDDEVNGDGGFLWSL